MAKKNEIYSVSCAYHIMASTSITLPETNSSPLKIGHTKGKGSSSNHPFLGAILVSRSVYDWFQKKMWWFAPLVLPHQCLLYQPDQPHPTFPTAAHNEGRLLETFQERLELEHHRLTLPFRNPFKEKRQLGFLFLKKSQEDMGKDGRKWLTLKFSMILNPATSFCWNSMFWEYQVFVDSTAFWIKAYAHTIKSKKVALVILLIALQLVMFQ